MEQVILGVSDVSSWLLWTFLSCKDSPIDSSKKSRVSAKFLTPYLFADVTVRGMEGYKCHRSKTTSNQQIEAEKKHEECEQKLCISLAATSCPSIRPYFAAMVLKAATEQGNTESRVEKEQNPYLGRPSSGVPDLEGKQEHSQQ